MFRKYTYCITGEIKVSEIVNQEAAVENQVSEEEHVENEVAENVAENEIAQTEEADSGDDDIENNPKFQKKLGALLSKERKKLQAKYAQNSSQNVPAQNADGMIYDEDIGQYVDPNTSLGQMVLYNQLKKDRQNQKVQEATLAAKQAEREELTERLLEGHEKFDNYQTALNHFATYGTNDMADALAGAKDPAAIVNFLSDKKGELQRISRLSPAKQVREIFRIEEQITPRKKLVTSATAPVNKVKSSGNVTVRPENMSHNQISDFWEKKYNSR
jgi:hypothetical protein